MQNKAWYYPTAFSAWNSEEYAAIQRVVRSGRFTMGAEVEAFEAEFAAYHSMRHGIMVNSGSSANLLMMAVLQAQERLPDTALVPALAWATTYAPLVQHRVRLKLLDCDETWCFKVADLGRAQLAIGVSILGVPATNAKWLVKEMQVRNGVFLEDNCEALGASYAPGVLCGTLGLMNSFSFFYSHQISAIEGGMVLTNDDDCARLCRILRAHGWTRDVSQPPTFDDEYNFTHFGYNLRPVEMHAAVARVQLRKLPEFIKERGRNLLSFYCSTDGLPITYQNGGGQRLSAFGIAFTVANKATRARLATALRASGVDCRLPTGGSFGKHPYGKPWGYQKTPNADHIHDTGLFLGNAPFPIPEQIERAVSVMRSVLGKS